MCLSHRREPNSARYWRLNEMQGIEACLRSPSQAHDPEDYERIVAQRQRLATLRANEARVLERFRRFTSRSHRA